MTRLRFSTAFEVFEAFPTLREDLQTPPTNESPAIFLSRLVNGATPEDGIAFCAYVLGRREAVWWACQCVRLLCPPHEADVGLAAAETWVQAPEEVHRLAALLLGTDGDRREPSTWLALAAGWSGGNIAAPGLGPIPTAPHYTAKAARVAILTGLARVNARERTERLGLCIAGGIRLMQPNKV